MPAQKGKSSLLAKLGDAGRKGFDNHKNDDTTFAGGSDLPPGIEGGIAELVECKFDTYKKGDNTGEYYFYAAGIVKSPKVVGDIPVEGLRTSIMEPMHDTPDRSRPDIESHLAWVLNEFRKLGVPTKDIGFDDLETVAAALKEEKPHFRFRTWKGEPTPTYKNPRVNHDWRGKCEYNGETDDGVVDETEVPKTPAKATAKPAAAPAKGAPKPAAKKEPEPEAPWDKDDLTAAGEAADNGDEDAQVKLADAARAVGIDPEAMGTWTEVVEAIVAAGAGDEAAAEEEPAEEEWKPAKDESYMYKPKGAKKAIEVQITAVFEASRKVNFKSLEGDGKSYKSISWDDLEQG